MKNFMHIAPSTYILHPIYLSYLLLSIYTAQISNSVIHIFNIFNN